MSSEKTWEDLSPQGKKDLADAEAYLRDKLRNSFQKVLMNCDKLDTLQTGMLDKNMFRTALSRSFACRLTDAEFNAFHLKYHAKPKRWVRLEHRPIDLKKVRALFFDMVGNNDLQDPEKMRKAEQKKKEAEEYVKSQMRSNYRAILQCFRALDLQETNSLPLEQFRRVLARYGGIRMTPDEWWGFSKLVDSNGDGRISLDEFEELFQNFDDGTENARRQQLGDFVEVELVEKMIAQKFADKIGPMEKMLQVMDLMLRGEIQPDHFRRTFIRFGLVLSDPEAEALEMKYTIGEGNSNIDYIRFLHNIRGIIEEAENGALPTQRSAAHSMNTARSVHTARSVASRSGRNVPQSARGKQQHRKQRGNLQSRKGTPMPGSSATAIGSARGRPLTARDKLAAIQSARRSGRLPSVPNTARGAARMSFNQRPAPDMPPLWESTPP